MKNYEALSKKHFDSQASEYDAKETAYYSKYPKISCRDVSERLRSVSYEKLLDVGCGTGYLFELLLAQREAKYHGLDLSPEMLKMAGAKFDSRVALVEGSADRLPYGITALMWSPASRASITMDDNQNFWQRFARLYSPFMEKGNGQLYNQIASEAKPWLNKELTVLELACGSSQLSFHLAASAKHWDATDFSENMIAEAKKKTRPQNLYFSVQDATKRPYTDESFDTVFSAVL